MYVHTHLLCTSLRTNQFNQVHCLQVSQNITVDLAAVSKLGVDFFWKYWERVVENKGGAGEEENRKSISLFSLYISLCLSLSIHLSLSLSLSFFLCLPLFLSLSFYLCILLFLKTSLLCLSLSVSLSLSITLTTYLTCSSPIWTFFLHALSFECTSKLCNTFINQFSVHFHF